MADDLTWVLRRVAVTGSALRGRFWAVRNGFYDDAADTYRLYRRKGNGWDRLLTANRRRHTVLDVSAPQPGDLVAVARALTEWGIAATVQLEGGRIVLRGRQGPPATGIAGG